MLTTSKNEHQENSELIRTFANTFEAHHPEGWNQRHDSLMEIADELDPPAPRPLLEGAEVGWVCQLKNGKWVTITQVDTDGMPIRTSDGLWYKLDGTEDSIPMKMHIIHAEPLAPEGTAEWAWQMLKIGKPVTNKRQFIAGGHIKDTDLDKYHFVQMWSYYGWCIYEPAKPEPKPPREPEYVICKRCAGSQSVTNPAVSNTAYTVCPKCGGTGYEIKPEPAKELKFEVGDWVEVSGRGGTIHGKCTSTEGTVSEPNNMIRACGYLFNPDGTDATYRCKTHGHLITRKLDPSEVVVKIGCLSGTVEKASDFDMFLLWHSKKDCDYSMIRFDALDPATRSLVESLLKAQEEK